MARMLKLFVAAVYFVAAAHSKSRYGRDTASDEAGHEERESACGAPTQGNHQNRVQSLEDRLAVLESQLIQDLLQGRNPGRLGGPSGGLRPGGPSGGPTPGSPSGGPRPGDLQPHTNSPFERIISVIDDFWYTELELKTREERQNQDFGVGIYGNPCISECHYYDYPYTWCRQRLADIGNWASSDYCSRNPGITHLGEACRTECMRDGTDYYWCWTRRTLNSWGYCSPSITVRALGAEGVRVPEFGVASVDEQPEPVVDEGVLLADQEARDQAEIPNIVELLDYLKPLVLALEDRFAILNNGVYSEERLANLNALMRLAQLSPVGIDGQPAPQIESP